MSQVLDIWTWIKIGGPLIEILLVFLKLKMFFEIRIIICDNSGTYYKMK